MEKIFYYENHSNIPAAQLGGTCVVYAKDTNKVYWDNDTFVVNVPSVEHATITAKRNGTAVSLPCNNAHYKDVFEITVTPEDGYEVSWSDGVVGNKRVVRVYHSNVTLNAVVVKLSEPLWMMASTDFTLKYGWGDDLFDYSYDKINWTKLVPAVNITVPANTKCYLAAHNNNPSGFDYTNFEANDSADIVVGGSILSLINKDYKNVTTIPNYAFNNLFMDMPIVDASQLDLDFTLTEGCFCQLFEDCSKLHIPPQLPALQVPDYGYSEMFYGCNLDYAPELPATSLGKRSYNNLFTNNVNLSAVKIYAPDAAGGQDDWYSAVRNWLNDTASTGVIHCKPGAFASAGASPYVPSGWTIIEDL